MFAQAKDLWPEENKFKISIEVDIEKLVEVCNWVSPSEKVFYYGYFEEDQGKEKHNKSIWRIDKAKRFGFQVKTKPIKMVPHYEEDGTFVGKFPKCNFDVEMTMTMLQKLISTTQLCFFLVIAISADYSDISKVKAKSYSCLHQKQNE